MPKILFYDSVAITTKFYKEKPIFFDSGFSWEFRIRNSSPCWRDLWSVIGFFGNSELGSGERAAKGARAHVLGMLEGKQSLRWRDENSNRFIAERLHDFGHPRAVADLVNHIAPHGSTHTWTRTMIYRSSIFFISKSAPRMALTPVFHSGHLLASHETNTLLQVTPLHAIPNWAGLLSLTTLRLGVICPDLEAVQKRIDMTSTQSEEYYDGIIDIEVPLKWSADSIQLELRKDPSMAESGSTRSDCLADVSGVSLADRGTVLDRTTLGMNELHRLLCVRFGFLNCFCIMSSRYDTSNQYNPVVHECPDVRLPGFLSTLEGRVIAAAHKLSEEFPFNRDYNISDQAGVDMTTGYNGLRGDAATFYPAPPVCGKIKFAYASHTFAAKEKGRNICSYQEKRGIHFSSNDFRCSGAVHSLEENHSLFSDASSSRRVLVLPLVPIQYIPSFYGRRPLLRVLDRWKFNSGSFIDLLSPGSYGPVTSDSTPTIDSNFLSTELDIFVPYSLPSTLIAREILTR
ncbi:hypothetical protein Moror_4562 [Moniliophthora roreri MCA 2997]|uniref:Uncharacterized protein n=1 Tax=Moniliophthora roreri (strain MCA 2997) TaxID=1381753 RepID=V2XIP5_MONRO|nr:hypothetical protein Moror_4562 [Moniliophthora roreri MCA 2997]